MSLSKEDYQSFLKLQEEDLKRNIMHQEVLEVLMNWSKKKIKHAKSELHKGKKKGI